MGSGKSIGTGKNVLPTPDNIEGNRREFLEFATLAMGHFEGASETMDSIRAMFSVNGQEMLPVPLFIVPVTLKVIVPKAVCAPFLVCCHESWLSINRTFVNLLSSATHHETQ